MRPKITIRFPEMRAELVSALQSLSDLEYQRAVWVKGEKRGKIQHDELDYSIHFLYDDTALSENAEGLVGDILKSKEEAIVVSDVIKQLDYIFSKYGTELNDSEYIELAEWSNVLVSSRRALKVMGEETGTF